MIIPRTIKWQLTLAFISLVILFSVVSGVSFFILDRIGQANTMFVSRTLPAVHDGNQLALTAQKMVILGYELETAKDSTTLRDRYTRFNQLHDSMAALIASMSRDDSETDLLALHSHNQQIRTLTNIVYQVKNSRFMPRARHNDQAAGTDAAGTETAVEGYLAQLSEQTRALASLSTAYARLMTIQAGTRALEVDAIYRQGRRTVIFLLLLTGLLSVVISWLYGVRRISNRLSILSSAITQQDTAMVRTQITIAGLDEIARMARAAESLLENRVELLNARSMLEKRVAERTRELQKEIKEHWQAEENARITLNSIGDAVIATDTDGMIIRMNPMAEKLTGWTWAEAQGKPLTDVFNIVNIRTKEPVVNPVMRVLKSGESIDLADHTTLIAKDRTECQIADSAAPIRNIGDIISGVVLVFRDVTEEHQMHEALRENEERLAEINERLLSLGTDFGANVDQLTALCGKLLGATCTFYNRLESGMLCSFGQWQAPSDYKLRDRPDGHICYDVIQQGSHDTLVVRNLPDTAYAKTDPNVAQYALKTYVGHAVRCGAEVVGSLCAVFQSDVDPTEGDKRILGIIAAALGAEEDRRQAEEEVRHLRNYLANIIDSMPSVLVGVDPDGTVTQWNREAQRVTGVSVADAVGQPLVRTFPQLAAEMTRVREAIQTREVRSDSRRPRKEGDETRYVNVTVYPLVANGVESAVIRMDDVTDQVRIEEMMIQSEKMLSVGGLAAGMAHEINNPLGGMMQTADVMSRRLTAVEMPANQRAAAAAGTSMEAIRAFMDARGIIRMLGNIRESGRRAAKIVANMLSFARKSDLTFLPHNLADLLDQTVDLVGSDYDLKKKFNFHQIEIIREYEDDLPDISCESGKIQQVLLNILRNGAQAMQTEAEQNDHKGMNAKKPRFILRLTHEQQANRARIEISDNGPGMDEATRKRVFEPFFTTKPVGVGTGLGLSVSYFIITENHDGEMNVESTPGEGTSFIIRLPLKRRAS